MTGDRFARRFAALRAAGRTGLITYITAGFPDRETSLAVLKGLPGAGADVIELGLPHPYPSRDGPVITAAARQARAAGTGTAGTLSLVRAFRDGDPDTPLVLMGYFGSVSARGVNRFARDAAAAGADGLLLADLPPAFGSTLGVRMAAAGLHLIRVVDPDTSDDQMRAMLDGAGGFVYFASTPGKTGGRLGSTQTVARGVSRLRRCTDLPVAVGIGIKTPNQAAKVAKLCDAVVVGSALVNHIADTLDKAAPDGQYPARKRSAAPALDVVREFADVLASPDDKAET